MGSTSAPPAVIKVLPRSIFAPVRKIESIFTGGKVIVSPDSLLITASGEDVFVTDLKTGATVHKLTGDSELITSIALRPIAASQTKRQLVTASRSLQLTVWDLDTGRVDRSWRAHEAPVIMMEFDPTGQLLATGSADSTIKLWDLDKAICTHNLRGHGGIISALRFHPDPNRWTLFSGSDDCQVRVWDLLAKKCVASLQGHVSVVRGLDVSPCGWFLVSGGRDKVINVWNLRNFQQERSFPIYETIESVGILSGYRINGDESKAVIFTGGESGRIRLWDFESTQCLYTQPASGTAKPQMLMDLIYCASHESLISVTADQNIIFYSLQSDLKRTRQVIGYNDEIIDMAFIGPKHDHLAVVTNSEQIRVFNMNTSDAQIIYGHQSTILCMDYSGSNDGCWLATGSKDNTARVWAIDFSRSLDEQQQQVWCVGECVGHAESVSAIGLSRKQFQFMITGSEDCTIKRWDLIPLLSQRSNDDQHRSMKLKAVYTHKAHEKDINSIAIAPNDRFFATGSQDKTVKLWNCEDGKLLGEFKGHRRGVWCVRFSPVEQLIASASGDKTIKLWSTSDYSCLKTFEGHTNSVLRLDFITNGTQLLSTGSDGLTKLWTIKTNECVMTRDDHEDKIWALAIRNGDSVVRSDINNRNDEADGEATEDKEICYFATGSGDSLITIYRDQTHEERQRLHQEQETKLLQDQDLSNFMVKKDFQSALRLALKLGKSSTACQIIIQVLEQQQMSRGGDDDDDDYDSVVIISPEIDQMITRLTADRLQQLLGFARDWNTNARFARPAQAVLSVVLRSHSPQQLVEVSQIKEIIDAFIPYTERHFARADQLLTDTWLVDYTLNEMDILLEQPCSMDEDQEMTGR